MYGAQCDDLIQTTIQKFCHSLGCKEPRIHHGKQNKLTEKKPILYVESKKAEPIGRAERHQQCWGISFNQTPQERSAAPILPAGSVLSKVAAL